MLKCIKRGMKNIEEFIQRHPEFKNTKGKVKITESLLSKKNNITFIKEKLFEENCTTVAIIGTNENFDNQEIDKSNNIGNVNDMHIFPSNSIEIHSFIQQCQCR